MTIKEWLTSIADVNESGDKDSKMMQNLLHRVGFPNAIVTCGVVYMTGYGNPVDIHSIARMMLKAGEY